MVFQLSEPARAATREIRYPTVTSKRLEFLRSRALQGFKPETEQLYAVLSHYVVLSILRQHYAPNNDQEELRATLWLYTWEALRNWRQDRGVALLFFVHTYVRNRFYSDLRAHYRQRRSGLTRPYLFDETILKGDHPPIKLMASDVRFEDSAIHQILWRQVQALIALLKRELTPHQWQIVRSFVREPELKLRERSARFGLTAKQVDNARKNIKHKLGRSAVGRKLQQLLRELTDRADT